MIPTAFSRSLRCSMLCRRSIIVARHGGCFWKAAGHNNGSKKLLMNSSGPTTIKQHFTTTCSNHVDFSDSAAAAVPRSFNVDGAWNEMNDETRALAENLLRCEHVIDDIDEARVIRFQRRFALARAITMVESKAPEQRRQADLLLTHVLLAQDDQSKSTAKQRSFRIGISGPPGAGKSTFCETLGKFLLDQKAHEDETVFVPSKLGVVCIDPSSTITGGSILGDKTRMTELSRHEYAYVRPSATGGTFGGMNAYTDDVVSLCQVAGYDLVLVETVGLGQSEVEVAQSVDVLLLLLPPGGGDDLQGMKKGIVEVSDVLVVNKADGDLLPAARKTAADYKAAMKFTSRRDGITPKVKLISCFTQSGLYELWQHISKLRNKMMESGQMLAKQRAQANYWMWKHFQNIVAVQTKQDPQLHDTAQAMQASMARGTVTPRVAASQLFQSLLEHGSSVNK